MKQPSFFEGVLVALIASLGGSILFSALSPMFAGAMLLRLLITGLGLGYVFYLLGRGRTHTGRVSILAGWVLMAAATWFLAPPLPLYLLVHLLAIWLVRSLYFYSSLLCALADLGLNGLSLGAAVWALSHSHSLLLSIWCFFLMQALFVAIPARLNAKTGAGDPDQTGEDRFEQAHRSARAAVRKLSSTH